MRGVAAMKRGDHVVRVDQARLHRAVEALVEEVAHRDGVSLSAAVDRVVESLERAASKEPS
jgi:hypothetical protein